MLRYLLAIPLIGITLLLAACSESPSSSGGVTLYSGAGGPFTVNVENRGGHGAIEVCVNSPDQPCTAATRIAVAEGQCGGPASCKGSATIDKSIAAQGLKIVWTAGHVGTEQSYLASAYSCSPGSKGCTSSKTTHMAKLDDTKTRIETTIKVDLNSETATIGATFSKEKPETGGGNYCQYIPPWGGGGELVQGDVLGSAACQARVNKFHADYGTIKRFILVGDSDGIVERIDMSHSYVEFREGNCDSSGLYCAHNGFPSICGQGGALCQ